MVLSRRLSGAAMVALIALLLGACTATNVRHNVHYTLVEPPVKPVPQKIILLPVDVRVKEISAGGVVEEVKAWSEAASANVTKAVDRSAATSGRFSVVSLPVLTAQEKDTLGEYAALYDLVAYDALLATKIGGPAWKHKVDHFDYTLGDGLRFLRNKTGADAVLFVKGEDWVSSSGRKAAMVFAAALGVGLEMGHSFLSAGVVDLNTGDLLWLDHSSSAGSRDLRQAEDARIMVDDMFRNFPGLEPYKQRLAGQH